MLSLTHDKPEAVAVNTKTDDRKNERVTARVSASMRETLEYAASLQGATISQFLVSCALKGAEEAIERERLLRLSGAESKIYLDLLASPPAPNPRMKSALKSYQSGDFRV